MAIHIGKLQGSVGKIYCSRYKNTPSLNAIYAFSGHIFRSDKKVIFYVTTNPKKLCY
jgi:hypothetical protein